MKYIALLRGINVSGKNKISMTELKKALQEYNYKNVSTCLNSGNVIFESDSDKQSLMQHISAIIRKKFNLLVPVLVITKAELQDVFNHNPTWWNKGKKDIYDNLIFIIPPSTYDEIYKNIGKPSINIEKIEKDKNFIFWSFDLKSYTKANWRIKTSSSSIKGSVTIRTANTIKKVLELCDR